MAAVETLPSSDLDTDRLSSFLDIDVSDLRAIIDSAAEGIHFLLRQVQVKATDYEHIRQAKDMLEINYRISQKRKVLSFRARGAYDQCQGYKYAGPASKVHSGDSWTQDKA